MIDIVPASLAHIGALAGRLRDIDRLECAVLGHTPKQALRLSLRSAACAWTAKIDGRPEAMFGAAALSSIDGIGSPWLLMTDTAVAQARALVELGRFYTLALHTRFRRLENYVHADNDVAIRWLSRLGYAVGPVDAINGHPMRGFARLRD